MVNHEGELFTLYKSLTSEKQQTYGFADYKATIEPIICRRRYIQRGINRLKNGCKKGYRIALMGAMQEPIHCHRCILLGRALREAGFNIKHILDDYTLASQEEMEEELLDKYYGNRNQITFDSYIGQEVSKQELLKKSYRHCNKEIGYRVEKINTN